MPSDRITQDQIDALRRERDEARAALRVRSAALEVAQQHVLELINQHCSTDELTHTTPGRVTIDSFGISANADAMQWLAGCGLITIRSAAGRRVLADWVEGREAGEVDRG